jgi:hypothetical protein
MKKTILFFSNRIIALLTLFLCKSPAIHAQDANISFPVASFTSKIINSGANNQVEFVHTGCSFSSSSYANCTGFTSGNTLRIDNSADHFDIITANSTINKIQVRIQANSGTAANAIVAFSADGATWANFSELTLPANNANPSCMLHEIIAPAGAKYYRMQRVAFGGYTAIGTVGQTVRIFEVQVFVNDELPLTLIAAKAFQQGRGISINWTTVNEESMRLFEIEKSNDGRIFKKVAGIIPQNTSAASYEWLDATPVANINYYRIKAISLNGESEYSQVLMVQTGKRATGFTLYPNPVKGNRVALQFTNMKQGQYQLEVFTNVGQRILSRQIAHQGGSSAEELSFDLPLPKGTYRVSLVDKNGERQNQVLLIQ